MDRMMKNMAAPIALSCAISAVASNALAANYVVACVGDSITYGHGSTEGRTYPAQLQEILGEGWQVLNFGHNARTALDDGKEWNGTEGMGYRSSPEFEKAKKSKPDVVIFMLGTNDSKPINWDDRSEDFKHDYTALVDDFLALDPAPVVIIGVSPFVKKDSFSIREWVVGEEIAPWQKAFAAERSLPCVDAHELLRKNAAEAFIGDGVHPNNTGYGFLANAFAAKLRELEPTLASRRAAHPRPIPIPRMEFDQEAAFAFLHVTDIQDRGKLSDRSAAVLRSSIAATKPALVVLTGDNVDGGWNGKEAFVKAMEPVVKIFEETGTKFCVTFGNHDSEKTGDDSFTRQQQYNWFRERGGKLFVDHDQPMLSGVGSGAIDIAVPDGGPALFRLYVMDSGDNAKGGGFDGCRRDQIEWYEGIAENLPHLWFQHIIVPDAADHGLFRAAAEGGVDMVVRGEKIKAALSEGVAGELKGSLNATKWETYRDEDHTFQGRTLYQSWIRNGRMKGAFFGHDHFNTFDGIDENGIRIGATKALTVTAFNDGDPGLRLFVIHADGSFETESATEKKPFPAAEGGRPYRPAPLPLPRAKP